jgi:hypothetical protein
MLGFWFETHNLARNLINIFSGRYHYVLTIRKGGELWNHANLF